MRAFKKRDARVVCDHSPLCGHFRVDAVLVQMCDEFARLEHLAHNIAAADKFAFDIELRNRGPIGVIFNALANIGIIQHIDAFEVHADIIENLHNLAGEAAHRKLMCALHEKDNVIAVDFGFDAILNCHGLGPCLPAFKARRFQAV